MIPLSINTTPGGTFVNIPAGVGNAFYPPLIVSREGKTYNQVSTRRVQDMQFNYSVIARKIIFKNPFNPGEKVFVLLKS
jgi:hypothetical protein